MDIYESLALKLDEFPLGASRTHNLDAILRSLFTPEEAETALLLTTRPEPLTKLAAESGQAADPLQTRLEAMAGKGLIYSKKKGAETFYGLLPIFPGVFELQFMAGQTGPARTAIARLFEAYYAEGPGRGLIQTGTPFARVIPVEREIPSTMEILPFERVSQYIQAQTEFALGVCYCRHEKELLGQGCGAPKDVCLIFGPFARFCAERGFARKVGREEALAALERAEQAGLVHVSDNVSEYVSFICNCCGCCCHLLRTITELGSRNGVASSRYVAVHTADDCTGCLTCVEKCQVKAVTGHGETVVLDQDQCIGCGVCVSHCPTGSMSLGPRDDYAEPYDDLRRLHATIIKERGLSD